MELGGTVPMQPERVTVDSYRGPAAPYPVVHHPPSAPPPAFAATAYAPQDNLAATALASPEMAGTMLAPPSPAQGPGHVPKYGTSPSGFRPPQPHVPVGPSPLDAPPRGEEESSSGGPVPWIILGVVLIAALIGAVAWALH
jgi:hypothetical protein